MNEFEKLLNDINKIKSDDGVSGRKLKQKIIDIIMDNHQSDMTPKQVKKFKAKRKKYKNKNDK